VAGETTATGISVVQQLKEFLGFRDLSKAVGDLTTKIGPLSGDLKNLHDGDFKAPNDVVEKLRLFGDALDSLCPKLQDWVKKCSCPGSVSGSSFDFYAQLQLVVPVGINTGGAGEGATATLPAARSNSLSPDVNVEVHNYGAQEEATGRSKSGRGLQQMVSDSVAKDMKRGGAGAIAIKHAFGVARQPIQR
jgi:hypothetical protein